jgi:hypothetical protein
MFHDLSNLHIPQHPQKNVMWPSRAVASESLNRPPNTLVISGFPCRLTFQKDNPASASMGPAQVEPVMDMQNETVVSRVANNLFVIPAFCKCSSFPHLIHLMILPHECNKVPNRDDFSSGGLH